VNGLVYALKKLARDKSTTLWAVAFPLVLATLFFLAFGEIDEAGLARPISIAVVDDAAYRTVPGLAETITGAASGQDPWLDVTYAADEREAQELVATGGFYGYVTADPSRGVQYHRDWREYPGFDPGHEIVTALLDSYIQGAAFAQSHPGARLGEARAFTEAVQLTAQAPSDQVRYFYSALGFAVVLGCNFALSGVARLRSGRSLVGARIAVGGTPRWRVLAPTIAAAYLLTLATLAIGYLYIRFVLQIAFGGREVEIAAILAVGALATTALGSALAMLPLELGVLTGLSASLACLLSLFAGLYGPGSQQLAEHVADAAAWSTWVNPARAFYDALFSLYCYDTFDQAASALGHMAVFAAVLFAVAALGLRRVRHEHL
jgi:hypothetical protein